MAHEREVRTFSTSLRAASKNGKRTLTGRAAAFGVLSADLGGFKEIIARDAFDSALQRGDEVIFCQNHNADLIVARTRNGSLRLQQSVGGLDFEADLPNTSAGNDLWNNVQAGLITECSFAFKALRDSWPSKREVALAFGPSDDLDECALPIRVLEDLQLYDCSAVSTPAYPSGTSVQVSSLALAEARNHGSYGSLTQEDEARRRRAHAWGERIRRDDLAARIGRK